MLWGTAPPEPRTRLENYPTLLFSWWATAFAAFIIVFRLVGRKIRTNVLFREDLIVALALIPLIARMVLVNFILQYGTNNIDTTHYSPTPLQIHRREVGSRLVLASRIMYALFIWMSKWTVSEFLKRIFYNSWRHGHELVLHTIRVFLLITFIGVVIATITECQPFNHYWQVFPDPGPRCRQGFAQLITMGVCDIITDILLVAFPIPLVLASHMSLNHRLHLAVLFSFSLLLIGITSARVPKVIERHGLQQYRTVWASIEILVSTFVANIIVVGSFVADKGVKKNKYRPTSRNDSIEKAPTLRPVLANNQVDSSEDLFRSIGCRMPADLEVGTEEHENEDEFTSTLPITKPAPVALSPATALQNEKTANESAGPRRDSRWVTPTRRLEGIDDRESTRDLAAFFRSSPREQSEHFHPPEHPERPAASLEIADAGGLLSPVTSNQAHTHPGQDSASASERPRSPPPSQSRGFRALMADIGGLAPSSPRQRPATSRSSSRSRSVVSERTQSPPPTAERRSTRMGEMQLQDIGGLLD